MLKFPVCFCRDAVGEITNHMAMVRTEVEEKGFASNAQKSWKKKTDFVSNQICHKIQPELLGRRQDFSRNIQTAIMGNEVIVRNGKTYTPKIPFEPILSERKRRKPGRDRNSLHSREIPWSEIFELTLRRSGRNAKKTESIR